MTKRLNSKNYNRIILEVLATKPIAFNPILARISNSARAGLFMSQLLYWWEKGKQKGWIYKTIDEVREETWLSKSEQKSAISRWSLLVVLEYKLKGIPAKRHFKINLDKLFEILEPYYKTSSLQDSEKLLARKSIKDGEFTKSNTDITQRVSQDISFYKREKVKNFNFEEKKKELSNTMKFPRGNG